MKKTYRYLVLILFLLSVLLTGCPVTTSPYYNESRINTILNNIKHAFNDHDIDALMHYVHHDYLHKGINRWEVRELWLDRMAEYLLIDFENVNIVIQNDEALVTFTMKLYKENETVYSEEPLAHGDLSYFWYDGYDWYVYGNQYLYKSNR
jgi:hypothetical protein